jgi:hypothetical protein
LNFAVRHSPLAATHAPESACRGKPGSGSLEHFIGLLFSAGFELSQKHLKFHFAVQR